MQGRRGAGETARRAGAAANMKIAIVGCGFVGLKTARLFHAAGWEVLGVTRAPESAAKLAAEPFRAVACDVADPAEVAACREEFSYLDAMIHCASSGRGGADAYRRVYLDGLQNTLRAWQPRRVVFTSSTSVYAQTDGSVVTEESPAEPDRETGKILRAAENLALAHGGIVARLAGIYGPGRAALAQKFLEGRAVIEGDGTRWLNQIHRDDAAGALFFLLEKQAAPGIYNVCDGAPVTQLAMHEWLAERFAKPLPPCGPIDPHRKRGWTHKRVSNAKLRALGWRPGFATFADAVRLDADLARSLDAWRG